MDTKEELINRIYDAYFNIRFTTPEVIVSDIFRVIDVRNIIEKYKLSINEMENISSNIVSKCKEVYIFDKEKIMEIISKELDAINN